MYSQILAPENRLSKKAVNVWIIRGTIRYVIWFAIFAVLFYLDHRFSWYEWIGWMLMGITRLTVLSGYLVRSLSNHFYFIKTGVTMRKRVFASKVRRI